MNKTIARMAHAIHDARIGMCWGKEFVGVREPWPNFDDPVVVRAYPHNPIAYVDVSFAEARAALASMREAGENASEMIERVGGAVLEALRQSVEKDFAGHVPEEIRRVLGDLEIGDSLGRAAIEAL